MFTTAIVIKLSWTIQHHFQHLSRNKYSKKVETTQLYEKEIF